MSGKETSSATCSLEKVPGMSFLLSIKAHQQTISYSNRDRRSHVMDIIRAHVLMPLLSSELFERLLNRQVC